MHDLPWDELGHRDPDHVGDGVDVLDDAPHLRCGQPARLGAQPEHELVAVDGVDVEMDGDAGAAGRGDGATTRRATRGRSTRWPKPSCSAPAMIGSRPDQASTEPCFSAVKPSACCRLITSTSAPVRPASFSCDMNR